MKYRTKSESEDLLQQLNNLHCFFNGIYPFLRIPRNPFKERW